MEPSSREDVALKSAEIKSNEERKKLLRRIFLFSIIGFSLDISGFTALRDLQTSINAEEGLGSMSLMTAMGSSIFCSIFVAPIIINFYGVKAALVACDINLFIFVLANLYPTWYTMIPASFLTGIGISLMFISMQTMCVYVAKEMSLLSPISKKKNYHGVYFGKYYAAMGISRLFGSALVYAILHGMKELFDHEEEGRQNGFSNDTTFQKNYSSGEDWSKCVANDCQMDYIYDKTNEKLDKFKPKGFSLQVLLSIFGVMHILAVIVHGILVPQIPSSYVKGHRKPSFFNALKVQLRDTFHRWTSLSILLIFPVYITAGLMISYAASELTRAYVSCTLGVEKVGIAMVSYGIAASLASAVFSRISRKITRAILLIGALVIDAVNFVVALMWYPTPSTAFVIYILAAMFGITFSMIMNGITRTTAVHQKDSVAIGYSGQTLMISIGSVIGFAWSVPLCVKTKIYILIPYYILAIASWGLADFKLRTQKVSTEQEAEI
uniref:protein unc-93 homolog A-like isoform X2 n=1 Tax=Styela clava TaxID=7725 RepID=UPI00193A0C69|nr:protein unc-93 homolog A-like isoform X2 [Styela clava]